MIFINGIIINHNFLVYLGISLAYYEYGSPVSEVFN